MAKCAECTYLDIDNDYDLYGAYWCEKKCERHLATDTECPRFCRAYNRSEGSINNALETSKSKNSSGSCYLTTILCNVLKMDDNNIYLQTMREFRNNVLQKNEKYKKLLVEYDIIGPKISKAIINDPLKEKVAKIFFEKDIVPITSLIKDNKYDEAVNAYYIMTSTLRNFYGINNFEISADVIDNSDIEKSGHGKYIKKKITL